jgi:Kef-type K+ transport system membrane component KefB
MLARGKEMGLVDDYLFTPIILIVIITSLISPLLLKLTIKKENRGQYQKIETSTAPDGVC